MTSPISAPPIAAGDSRNDDAVPAIGAMLVIARYRSWTL